MAGRGRVSDVTAARRKQRGLCAVLRRLHGGAADTMPVTGKTFRRRRADSESEEDEQDSEEVRCVPAGVSRARPARGLATARAPGCPSCGWKKWGLLGVRPPPPGRGAPGWISLPGAWARARPLRRGRTGEPAKLPAGSGRDLSLCVTVFQTEAGGDPRGTELEEEAQRGEVGTAGGAGVARTGTRPARVVTHLLRPGPSSRTAAFLQALTLRRPLSPCSWGTETGHHLAFLLHPINCETHTHTHTQSRVRKI